MTRFKLLTIASALATAFAVPAALAQQPASPDSSGRTQQRDATGNPAGSPTQPPRPMASDRAVSQYGTETVRDVQQALQNKGYDVGTVDGVMGPRTESALRQFQQKQGLTSSGRIDARTMSALDVQPSDRSGGTLGSTSDRSRSPSGAAGTGNPGSGTIGTSPSGSATPPSGTAGSSSTPGGTLSGRGG